MIRASEIGEYVYCQRAWWLHQVEGIEPAGRERREHGTALHAQHGRAVQASTLLALGGIVLLVCALLILLR